MREAAGASRRDRAEALAGARSLVACVDIDALARRSETSPSGLRALERSAALGARAASAASDDDPWSRCANAERLLAESASLGEHPPAGPRDPLRGSPAFDCAALPACAPSCAGPNGRLLGSATRVAGCAAEDALHFTVARFFLLTGALSSPPTPRGAPGEGRRGGALESTAAGDAGFGSRGSRRTAAWSRLRGSRGSARRRAPGRWRAPKCRAAAKHVRGWVALARRARAVIRDSSPSRRNEPRQRPERGATTERNRRLFLRQKRRLHEQWLFYF